MNKLLEFQQKVEAIKKDSKNPFFKSNYFDINSLLAEIKPLLNELGLVLLQPLDNIDLQPALRTVIFDSETGKEIIDSTIPLPNLQDPQKMGAVITYYRRYAIQSMLCLQAEDDDGNKASSVTPKATQAPVSVAKPKDDIETIKREIITLCKNLNTTLSEGQDYINFVQDKCGVDLTDAKNYQFIIKTLKELQ